ncbi:hypothetical protein [Kosakonia sp. 1610]|uniref:hypothetical protein n=1 Tax=Kosakonia sp. 1610 TaxID=3156426 RepID=UPI003D218D15
MELIEYINLYYGGNQAAFGRALATRNGAAVSRAQVGQWCDAGYVVINHTLYSPRRELPIPPESE